MKKILSLITVLSLCSVSFANDNPQSLDDNETRLSICTMIAQGSLTVATARQKGASRQEAENAINETLTHLKSKFRHSFVDYIATVWYADIERVYQMPVLATPDEKSAFAAILEELSYSECMGQSPNINM